MAKKHKPEDLAWLTSTVAELFNSNVLKSERPDGCWVWEGPKYQSGHGYLFIDGKNRSAARISYALHDPPTPLTEGYHVMCRASCAKRCVNPAHLIQSYAGAYSIGRINATKTARRDLTGDEIRRIYQARDQLNRIAIDMGLSWTAFMSLIAQAKKGHVPTLDVPKVIKRVKKTPAIPAQTPETDAL